MLNKLINIKEQLQTLSLVTVNCRPAFIKIGVELEFYSVANYQELEHIIKGFTLINEIKKEYVEQQFEALTIPTRKFVELIDEINRFKNITSDINDFSAKPFLEKLGSATQVHISIHDEETNENLLDTNAKLKFHVIGGLCASIMHSMVKFAPSFSSYKRFQYHDEFTPRFVTWGFLENRFNSIRVTKHTIEHRVPGADADIAEVIIEILKAIHHGIDQQIMPGKANFGKPKHSEYSSVRIPLSLHESSLRKEAI